MFRQNNICTMSFMLWGFVLSVLAAWYMQNTQSAKLLNFKKGRKVKKKNCRCINLSAFNFNVILFKSIKSLRRSSRIIVSGCLLWALQWGRISLKKIFSCLSSFMMKRDWVLKPWKECFPLQLFTPSFVSGGSCCAVTELLGQMLT